MKKQQVIDLLDFLLNSFRAQLAVRVTSSTPSNSNSVICPFDFQSFLIKWKSSQQQHTGTNDLILTLKSIAAQGLLDSIIPYLVSALGLNQTKNYPARTTMQLTATGFPHSHGIALKLRSSVSPDDKNRDKNKNGDILDDCEIIIHVCDESHGIREDFHFQQSVLTKEMGYFTHVAVKGQRLRDLDISVHCDLNVFNWLIRWIRAQGQGSLDISSGREAIVQLDPKNSVGIAVSADFLQMPVLVSQCLDYMHENVEQIIGNSPNLSCLSGGLIKKLAGYFRNVDLENRIVKLDRTDRITSRLFAQHILALNSPEAKDLDFMSPDPSASTETLFRCEICGQLLTNSIAAKIRCVTTRLDSRGRFYAVHIPDGNWSLRNHLRELKRDLRSWRRVYWRLWGTVHFFQCGVCDVYFPGKALETCRFHPDPQTLTLLSIPKVEDKLTHARLARNNDPRDHYRNLMTGIGNREIGNRRDSPPTLAGAMDPKGNAVPASAAENTNNPSPLPFRKMPCCDAICYKYSPNLQIQGCQQKEHVAYNELEEPWLTLLELRDLIVQESAVGAGLDMVPRPPSDSVNSGGKIQLRPPPAMKQSSSPRDLTSKPTTGSKYSIFMRTLPSSVTPPTQVEESSSTDSDDSGDGSGSTTTAPTPSVSNNSRRMLSQLDRTRENCSWIWNQDLSTRYNQDMQREREEMYMVNLAAMLVQRIPLESSKFQFLRRRAPKEDTGGSFAKLEHDFLS